MKKFQLENEYCEYIILDIINGQYWLNCFSNSHKYKIEITDIIDIICQKLNNINIQDWNGKNFDKPWNFTPNFEWKLNIYTDNLNINCLGLGNFPSNWNDFINILNFIGFKS